MKVATLTMRDDGADEYTVSGWPITNFGSGQPIINGKDGTYIISITGLSEGDYRLMVEDKQGFLYSSSFRIGDD